MKKYRKLIIISAGILIADLILYIFSGHEAVLLTDNNIFIDDERVKNVDIDIETDNLLINNFSLPIPAYMYADDELNIMAMACEKNLYRTILNGNESYDMVTHDLYFPESLDDYPLKITYETTDELLLDFEGVILCEEPFDSEIIIVLSYGSYLYDFSIPVHVEPDRETWERIEKEKLEKHIIASMSSEDAMIKAERSYVINLPGDVNDEKVKYYYSGKPKNKIYLIAGPALVAALFWGFKKDEKENKKKHDEIVLDEYPGMIQKMSLYLVSGMTVRNIWFLLCEEAEKKNNCENPLFNEMRVSANELRSGILENTVYKKFGERIQIPEIVRFSALLSQNIRKGGAKLSDQLTEESKSAFEKKKQRVMKRGAEAGTKLLFPMMLLLIDVMVMIIIPAFWNI